MDCPAISGLKLSEESIRGISRIKNIPGLANKLAGSMSASQIISIFASPTPPSVTIYSIHSMDWHTFSHAMAGVPAIAKASMVKEAQNQWASAQLRNKHLESKFWRAVADGCRIR